MRNFFRSPLFRILICLVLVCCILVNSSPIYAEAFSAGAALTAVVGTAAAVTVVAGAMQALGVMPDASNTSVFEGVVNDCVDALTASGVFLNGMATVLQLSDGVVVKNHVNQGIIEAILSWLFGNSIVTETSVSDGYALFNGLKLPFFPDLSSWGNSPYLLIAGGSSNYYLYVSDVPFVISTNGSLSFGASANGSYEYYSAYANSTSWKKGYSGSISTGSMWTTSNIFWANHDIYDKVSGELYLSASVPVVGSSIGIASGLIAGQIGTEVETDYETWVDDGVIAVDFGIGYVDDPNTNQDDDDDDTGTEISPTVPPGEVVDPNNPSQPTLAPSPWWQNNRWLNIGGGIVGWELGQLIQQLLTQTQTQTQTAVSDPQYRVDTSLFGNGGNGNNVITPPDTGDPDPSTPTDPSVPDVPSDISAYTFNLNDIFPFCIPFDLYDFLTCLDAAPVAPVIEWALQLPGGGTFPITIDLSAFDSVAQLLRRLELLIFCVGLALKTRDLIKG